MADKIEFHREPVPAIEILEREWRRLEAAASPSFFVSWQWIGTMLAALPPESRPSLLRGCNAGETVALALLGASTTRRRGGLIRSRGLYVNETGNARFDTLTIEHNGLLTPAGRETAVWEALAGWFAELRDEADELHLRGSLGRLPESAVEQRGLYRNEIVVPSYSVELGRLTESDGELYPVLSANARQQLRRALRHFERFGPVRITEASTPQQQLEYFGGLRAMHSISWARRGKAHAFAGPFFESFHRLLIERSAAEGGGIQLLRACAGERILGYLYNFRRGGRVYAYQSGFDDGDKHERPGTVAHAMAIRHAFHSGAQIYDFMAGRNQLKESVATRCEAMLWQVIQQPRLGVRLERLALRWKQATAGRLLPSVVAPPDLSSTSGKVTI